MTIEVVLLISVVSVAFGLYQGIANLKRNQQTDTRNDVAQLTTVIVKLENIGIGITEIKNEMSTVKNDIKEDRSRIIKTEEIVRSIVNRMNICEKHCKRFGGTTTVSSDE